MASYPCTDDPSEIIEAVVGAGENAEKFDKFVNGGVLEEVQLGTGEPTPVLRNLVHLVKSATVELDGTDISGKLSDAANEGTVLRMLADHFGDFVNLRDFGAVGDGTTNDAAAWDAFQTALANGGGLGYIPGGNYKIVRNSGGTTTTEYKRFESGCIGNGLFDDTLGFWSQVHRNPTDESYDDNDNYETSTILQHKASYNATAGNSQEVRGPIIKTQTDVAYTMTDGQASANFTRVIGAYHEGVGHGNYECQNDSYTGNFTTFGAAAHNKFAGNFGMTAVTGRVWDADETEVPAVATYGASKSCGGYFPFIRKAKHVRGGYMIGLETYCMNRAAETGVAYENNDTFVFGTGGAWTAGYHCTGYGGSHDENINGAPISAAIMIDGASDANHAFWNGIVIGSSAMKINNDTVGHAGTVGISFASWRPTRTVDGVTIPGRYGDQAIRFGYANHHLHFKSGARIWSPDTVFGYEGTADDDQAATDTSGILIMAPANGIPYLNMGTGVFNGTRTLKYGIRVNGTDGNVVHNLRSGSSHVFAFTSSDTTTYAYNLNTGYFTCSGSQTLGTGQSLWGQIYSTNSTISTSDERLKQDIAAVPDALLDAWGGVNWRQYRFRDAVSEKGESARTHTGLVAQHVKAVLDAAGLNPTRYGFLCHDEWDAVYEPVDVVDEPAHFNDKDELIPERVHEEMRLAKPAGDAWSLRYEEALCIEAAYLRREIARIKAHVGMN